MKFRGTINGLDMGETYEQARLSHPPFLRAARAFAVRYAEIYFREDDRPTESLRVLVEDRHGRHWTVDVRIGWKPVATKAREVEG